MFKTNEELNKQTYNNTHLLSMSTETNNQLQNVS